MTTEFFVGTVIQGTLRSQDLLPAFLEELSKRDPIGYDQWAMASFGIIPSYVTDEGDDSDWWTSEDCNNTLEQAFEALEMCAPDGYYFGAHEGDRSDFGYWPVEDQEE